MRNTHDNYGFQVPKVDALSQEAALAELRFRLPQLQGPTEALIEHVVLNQLQFCTPLSHARASVS